MIRFRSTAPVILLTALIPLLTACGEEEYETDSLWRGDPVAVDGNTADWLGKLSYIEETGISIGVQNDDRDLYVCITTEDPSIRAQVMRAGLIVWFDPDAGKGKVRGIRFPIGMSPPDREGEKGFPGENRPENRPGGENEADTEQEKRARPSPRMPPMRDVLLLEPGEKRERRVALHDLNEIDVEIDATGTVFVYELRVPLQAGDESLFGIGASSGSTFDLGLEIPELKMSRDGSGMRDGMAGRGGGMGGGGMRPGSGMGGGMGGRGGGMGGGTRPGGRMPSLGKAVKMWVTTHLAESSSPPLS